MTTVKKNEAGIPLNYLPSANEEHMNPTMLKYFQHELLKRRQDIVQECNDTIAHLGCEKMSGSDHYDNAAKAGDIHVELRIRDRYRKLLKIIDRSLKDIDDGNYGYCIKTGDPIPIERLLSKPTANMSIDAQERHESYERMHSDK